MNRMKTYTVEGVSVLAGTPGSAVRKVKGEVRYGHWEEVADVRGWNQEVAVTDGKRTWLFVAMDNG